MATNDPKTRPQLILHPRWIVPVIPRETVLERHSLSIANGKILAILPTEQARMLDAQQHVDLPDHALTPGFVNSHGHAAMSLFRGFADDVALMTWLNQLIWPAETTFVSEDFVRDGSDLALAELALSGTTTVSDNYFFPNIMAARADRIGLRAQLCFPVIDVPTAWASQQEEYLAKGLALRDSYRDHDRIEVAFGPHATYSLEEHTLQRIATLANELDAPIQIHLHETRGEVQQSVERIGERPIDQLQRIGMLGPRTQCVHMTALANEDIQVLVETGAHVVHCPRSNMKLASGNCPVQRLLDAGVNVALGTDGAASNNRLNMLAEMQTAALLAKLDGGEPTALSAQSALEMATINGAKALGIDAHTGSLEPGKAADIIAINLGGVHTQPVINVVSQLVYATSGQEVSHSWVAGQAIVTDGQLRNNDLNELLSRAEKWREPLLEFRQQQLSSSRS